MLVMLDLEGRLSEVSTRKQALLELLALLAVIAEQERLSCRLDELRARILSLEAQLLRPKVEKKIAALTLREHHVLVLVAQGYSDSQIAGRLVISERTARSHVHNILHKLHLRNRTQLALLTLRTGILTPEEAWETVINMTWRELP